MRQFKVGKPVPTAIFETVGLFNATPKAVEAEVIETPGEGTSQPPSANNHDLPDRWK